MNRFRYHVEITASAVLSEGDADANGCCSRHALSIGEAELRTADLDLPSSKTTDADCGAALRSWSLSTWQALLLTFRTRRIEIFEFKLVATSRENCAPLRKETDGGRDLGGAAQPVIEFAVNTSRPPSSPCIAHFPSQRLHSPRRIMAHERREALETAIACCIRDTFQTEEARNKLSQACEGLSLTDEACETILCGFSQLVASKALEQVTQWSQENELPRKWQIIDRFATLAPAMTATMNDDIHLPSNSVPQLKLTEQLIAQKQKEIDKLQQIVAQRQAMLDDVNRQLNGQENRTHNFKNNIDNSFTRCVQKLETCARAIN
ncbi:hypothetical protein FGB62_26g019 [Gracilaria domingensis]|nr:hypothetical protein FGB62_26g019 [Gracilaria domingensis]